MNVLLVYPKCPDSFWSFTHALKFIAKKSRGAAAWVDYGVGHVAAKMGEETG